MSASEPLFLLRGLGRKGGHFLTSLQAATHWRPRSYSYNFFSSCISGSFRGGFIIYRFFPPADTQCCRNTSEKSHLDVGAGETHPEGGFRFGH